MGQITWQPLSRCIVHSLCLNTGLLGFDLKRCAEMFSNQKCIASTLPQISPVTTINVLNTVIVGSQQLV